MGNAKNPSSERTETSGESDGATREIKLLAHSRRSAPPIVVKAKTPRQNSERVYRALLTLSPVRRPPHILIISTNGRMTNGEIQQSQNFLHPLQGMGRTQIHATVLLHNS